MSKLIVNQRIAELFKSVQNFADRAWYGPFIGFLAFIDYFVIVVPTDGILISSSILQPKRWGWFAICISVGSTAGAIAFAAVVQKQGLPWILELYPSIQQTKSWIWSAEFFGSYGMLVVLFIAATPLIQHPIIILACLANSELSELTIYMMAGRLFKSLIMAYIGSHTPKLLGKMWGIQGELKELDIKTNNKSTGS